MEADIKLITGISDVNMDFIRDYRHKDYDYPSDTYSIKTTSDGLPFPMPVSRKSWKKELIRRVEELGLKSNADGTLVTLDFLTTVTRLHRHSVHEKNTSWQPGQVLPLIFSGDGLQTARGESHTLCCIRSGRLIEGYTSAFNYYPISNVLGSDKWPNLNTCLDTHKSIVSQAVMEKKIRLMDNGEVLKVELFCTGDLAFLLSFLGLNPASSTYGNPWIVEIKENGTVIWRKDEDMYLLGHDPPPGHCWPAPIKCPVCPFKATSQAEVDKDKEIKRTAAEVKTHLGKYAHQTPVFPIGPSHTMPPIYHMCENLIAYRFKHLIWEGLTKEQQYDVNCILQEKLGESSKVHLPPTRGDEVYCCSWIGQDVCNLRATDTIVHVIQYCFPNDWEAEAPMEQARVEAVDEAAPISHSNLDEFENMYSDDEEESEVDIDEQLSQTVQMGEHLHAATELKRSQLVGDSFDTAFDFIDEVVDWDWEDTPSGRAKQSSKLKHYGKAANQALKRALITPVESEYDKVIEHVVPQKIISYGKLVQQANEQGQESAGQMFKSRIRNGANKRRKVGDYMRPNKKGNLVLCKFRKTATTCATETFALKQDAAHTTNSRLTKKLKVGHKKAELQRQGKRAKRERQFVAPNLLLP